MRYWTKSGGHHFPADKKFSPNGACACGASWDVRFETKCTKPMLDLEQNVSSPGTITEKSR